MLLEDNVDGAFLAAVADLLATVETRGQLSNPILVEPVASSFSPTGPTVNMITSEQLEVWTLQCAARPVVNKKRLR